MRVDNVVQWGVLKYNRDYFGISLMRIVSNKET